MLKSDSSRPLTYRINVEVDPAELLVHPRLAVLPEPDRTLDVHTSLGKVVFDDFCWSTVRAGVCL